MRRVLALVGLTLLAGCSTDATEGGSGCDPNYSGACVPDVDYDLDCADISGSVTVVRADPHGFDRDGDGAGCKSN